MLVLQPVAELETKVECPSGQKTSIAHLLVGVEVNCLLCGWGLQRHCGWKSESMFDFCCSGGFSSFRMAFNMPNIAFILIKNTHVKASYDVCLSC